MRIVLLSLAMLTAAPALAQDASAPPPSPPNPGTTALNSTVLQAHAEAQGQYAIDMQTYAKAAAIHDGKVAADQVRYQNQQQAYADAMFAWRMQVAACNRGKVKACKAPAPDPADFY